MIERNSKTHLKIRFSFFCAPFRASLASKFAKSADISQPISFSTHGCRKPQIHGKRRKNGHTK